MEEVFLVIIFSSLTFRIYEKKHINVCRCECDIQTFMCSHVHCLECGIIIYGYKLCGVIIRAVDNICVLVSNRKQPFTDMFRKSVT